MRLAARVPDRESGKINERKKRVSEPVIPPAQTSGRAFRVGAPSYRKQRAHLLLR